MKKNFTNDFEVVVHIGLEKTGTTSIQQTLSANSASLAACGVYFDTFFSSSAPGSAGNSVGLVLAAQSSQRRAWRRGSPWHAESSFEAYEYLGPSGSLCSSSPLKKIIFSAEHLSSQLTEISEIRKLADFLRSLSSQVKVISYVRRPDLFINSLINEFVKAGGTFNLSRQDDLVQKVIDGGKARFCNTLLNYIDVFGVENVILRRFDKGYLHNEDVVDDFFRTCGITAALHNRPKLANSSYSREALYVYSLLTDVFSVTGSPTVKAAKREVLKHGKGRANFITREQSEKLLRSLEPQAAQLEAIIGREIYDRSCADLPIKRTLPRVEEILRLARLPLIQSELEVFFGFHSVDEL